MASILGMKPLQAPGNNLVVLCGQAQLDASGQAVTGPTGSAAGVPQRFSVARTSAGIYTITLKDKWIAVYSVDVQTVVAGATPANRGGGWKVDSQAVNASTPTIVIRNELAPLAGSAGVAVDPPNSALLLITLILDRGRI